MNENSIARPAAAPVASLISRLRRNHGLEHATLHVLAGRYPDKPMAGHSDWGGFWIVGDLPTEAVASAVRDALQRLRNGEAHLAIHPTCGTNLVTSGVLAGTAAALAMMGAGRRMQDRMERLPLAVTLATLGILVAQPLGFILQQQVTTSGQPGALQMTGVQMKRVESPRIHRVATAG